MELKKIKNIIFVILFFAIILAPLYVFALEIDYPAIPTPLGPIDLNTITESGGFTVAGLVFFIYGAAVWVAGILAFIILVYVGFIYIISGSGLVGRGKAKRRLKDVLFGLVILLFVGVILNVINPKILELKDPLLVFVTAGDATFEGFAFNYETKGTYEDEGSGGEDPGPGISCLSGEEPPPPDTGSRVALCSTGTECQPWCYDPKGSGIKGPAEILKTDAKYAENWPAIYPSSCTVKMKDISYPGWLPPSSTNTNLAGYSAFIQAFQKAGIEASSQGRRLFLTSGYRPLYDQVRIACWNGGRTAGAAEIEFAINGTGCDGSPCVADPGRSPHGVGVALDIELYTDMGVYMPKTCAYAIQLKNIMFDSDPNWYRYSGEYWHFEYWLGEPPSLRVRDRTGCGGF